MPAKELLDVNHAGGVSVGIGVFGFVAWLLYS